MESINSAREAEVFGHARELPTDPEDSEGHGHTYHGRFTDGRKCSQWTRVSEGNLGGSLYSVLPHAIVQFAHRTRC